MANRLFMPLVCALALASITLSWVAFTRVSDVPPSSPPTGATTDRQQVSATSGEPNLVTADPREEEPPVTARPPEEEEPDPGQLWWTAVERPGADLLVVGDHTVNNDMEWIVPWARLQDDRSVDIAFWHEATDDDYREVLRIGSGSNAGGLKIWNASREGTSIGDAVERLDRFVRQGESPDAALITLAADGTSEQLDDLVDGLREVGGRDLPIVVVLAPSGWANEDLVSPVGEWAEARGFATIDIEQEVRAQQPTPEEAAEGIQDVMQSWADSS